MIEGFFARLRSPNCNIQDFFKRFLADVVSDLLRSQPIFWRADRASSAIARLARQKMGCDRNKSLTPSAKTRFKKAWRWRYGLRRRAQTPSSL
ncbi:MAG: hypothetical protein AAF773_20015, partial [Cyanobacteria bacterium P01_D01_bin.115]